MPKFILKITAESAENCIDEKNVECFILSASLPEDCLGRIIRKIEAAEKLRCLKAKTPPRWRLNSAPTALLPI